MVSFTPTGSVEIRTSVLGAGAAITAPSTLPVAATSGAGIASGLSAAGRCGWCGYGRALELVGERICVFRAEPRLRSRLRSLSGSGISPGFYGYSFPVTSTYAIMPFRKCPRTLHITRYVPGSAKDTDSTRFCAFEKPVGGAPAGLSPW
jgi:hypothetical protein